MGAKTAQDYKRLYDKDPLLPSNPNAIYRDFPGYKLFLGTQPYPTWQEAAVAARALGIKDGDEYTVKCKQDRRLLVCPHWYYKDFPGFKVFLGTERKFYPTWQEASAAVIKLGIQTKREFEKRYSEDPKLTIKPQRKYSDFPSWKTFLGKGKK